jgi:hypothetical protein
MEDNSETKTEDTVNQYLILGFLENEMEKAMQFFGTGRDPPVNGIRWL